MAHVLQGSHSFTCTPCIHLLTEWTIPAVTLILLLLPLKWLEWFYCRDAAATICDSFWRTWKPAVKYKWLSVKAWSSPSQSRAHKKTVWPAAVSQLVHHPDRCHVSLNQTALLCFQCTYQQHRRHWMTSTPHNTDSRTWTLHQYIMHVRTASQMLQ